MRFGSVHPPGKKIAGGDAGKQTGACKQWHTKSVFTPIQIDERKTNPKTGIKEANHQAAQTDGTAEKMNQPGAQFIRDLASSQQSQKRRKTDENRHSHRLLLDKISHGDLLFACLCDPRHCRDTKSVATKISRQAQ